MRDLGKEALSIRPGDRKAWDLRDVLAFGTSSVFIRGVSRGGRVTRVERQELNGAALYRGGVPGWASGVNFVAVLDCHASIVTRV